MVGPLETSTGKGGPAKINRDCQRLLQTTSDNKDHQYPLHNCKHNWRLGKITENLQTSLDASADHWRAADTATKGQRFLDTGMDYRRHPETT